jgi:ubiquinone/menaquinone biosynthesis C-methylase UbiE
VTEAIFDPLYWRRRLAASREIHQSVFRCTYDRWWRIEQQQQRVLAKHIQPGDCILDAGCGYGRLLDLLPANWKGEYLGIDLSPDMIREATVRYGDRPRCFFAVGDLRELPTGAGPFDWAILVSVRPMVIRNAGAEAWADMERELQRVSRRRLYLEYDEIDGSSVE